jgi:hypothetical protein
MSNNTAQQILLSRGRGYLYKQRYPQVVVFSKSLVDIYKLKTFYGGNHYKHNSGYVWMITNKRELRLMLDSISPCRSSHGFEDIVESFLEV